MTRLFQAEGAATLARWLNVLKAGGTLKTMELTKLADVDMSFPASIQKQVAYVGSSVTTYKVENFFKNYLSQFAYLNPLDYKKSRNF